MSKSKSIFQVINYADGSRSPAILCTRVEFSESCRKVYGIHVDNGDGSIESNYTSLKNFGVLVIAELEPDADGIIDRRGVSRAPIMRLDRFCHLALEPDVPFEG